MQKIVEGLYISDYLYTPQSLSQNEITNILSVLDLKQIKNDSINHKVIPLLDVETADLLIVIQHAFDFIQTAIDLNQNVLVHWYFKNNNNSQSFAGISRSSAVVIAYLMKSQQKTLEESLHFLQSIYPIANPNSGFMEQLELYEKMGYTIDRQNREFRRYLVSRMTREFNETGVVCNLSFSPQPIKSSTQKSIRCKKCRQVLASTDNILSHPPARGQIEFSYFKRDYLSLLRQNESITSNDQLPIQHHTTCSSFFVEPMDWAREKIEADGDVEGKLYCPNERCLAKLGGYNWAGATCSCGAWITPAFMLQRAKVDHV